MATKRKDPIKLIEMGLIDEPDGVIRLDINPDTILELSESIKAIGLLQPILVRPKGERYEIVFGHRRFLATQKLGAARIMATIRGLDDPTTALMRATENMAREDITPVEEAAIYQDLIDNGGLRIDQIADRLGRSGGIIKRRLTLLRMPTCLQKAIHKKEIGYSVAEELWPLGDGPDLEYLLMISIDHGATQSVVRTWVKDKLDERRRKASGTGEGGGVDSSPLELKPTYYACDICHNPTDLNKSEVMRMCKQCKSAITKGLEVTE